MAAPLFSIHLLVPSSTDGVLLEARIFLPDAAQATVGAFTPLAIDNRDQGATSLDELPPAARDAIKALDIRNVVTVAHPWAKLGGNMSFPVCAWHIPHAVMKDSAAAPHALVATFNVRGVGKSGGSAPWLGFGIGKDADDFAAVERAAVALTGRSPKLYRVGYSYGTLLALNAPPPPHGVWRTLLVSPAPTLFKALTALSGPTFAQGVNATRSAVALHPEDGAFRDIWLVYGSEDAFTGVATFRQMGEKIVPFELEGCGHFYERPQDAADLRAIVQTWVGLVSGDGEGLSYCIMREEDKPRFRLEDRGVCIASNYSTHSHQVQASL